MKRMNIHAWGHSASVRKWCADATTDTPSSCHARWLGLRMLMLTLLLSIAGGTAWAQTYHTPSSDEEITWTTKDACENADWIQSRGRNNNEYDAKTNQSITLPESGSKYEGINFKNSGKKELHFYVTGVSSIVAYTKFCSSIETGKTTPNLQISATPSDNSSALTSDLYQITANGEEVQGVLTGLDPQKQYDVKIFNTSTDKDLTLFAVKLLKQPFPAQLWLIGNIVGHSWDYSLSATGSNGAYTWRNVDFTSNDSYHSFRASDTEKDWSSNHYGSANEADWLGDGVTVKGIIKPARQDGSNNLIGWSLNAGTYDITINLATGTVTATPSVTTPIPDVTVTPPSFKQRGNTVEITIKKLRDVVGSGYDASLYYDSYMEYWVNGSEVTQQAGFSQDHDASQTKSVDNVTSSVKAKHLIRYNIAGSTDKGCIYSEEVTYNLVPAPSFSVNSDGSFEITNYAGTDYTYYYTTDDTDPTDPNSQTRIALANDRSTRVAKGSYDVIKLVAIRNDNDVITPVGTQQNVTVAGIVYTIKSVEVTAMRTLFGKNRNYFTGEDFTDNVLTIDQVAIDKWGSSQTDTYHFYGKPKFKVTLTNGTEDVVVEVKDVASTYYEDNIHYSGSFNAFREATFQCNDETYTIKYKWKNAGQGDLKIVDAQTKWTFSNTGKWPAGYVIESIMGKSDNLEGEGDDILLKADNAHYMTLNESSHDNWLGFCGEGKRTSGESYRAAIIRVKGSGTLKFRALAKGGRTIAIYKNFAEYKTQGISNTNTYDESIHSVYISNDGVSHIAMLLSANDAARIEWIEWVPDTKIEIKNPDCNAGVDTDKNWTGIFDTEGIKTGGNVSGCTNTCAEAFETDFDVHQTVTGLTSGHIYKLTVQAFCRMANLGEATADDDVNSIVYMGGSATPVINLLTTPLSIGLATGNYNDPVPDWSLVEGSETMGYVNNMYTAASVFAKDEGYFTNTVYAVAGEDGTLTFGIKGVNGTGRWTCWDNFRLTDLGTSTRTISLDDLSDYNTITATVSKGTPDAATIVWTSSNQDVATVASEEPTSRTATVISKANGTTTITATLMEGGKAVAVATKDITVNQTLTALTDSYKWVKGVNFGDVHKYEVDQSNFIVDNNHLQYVPSDVKSKNRYVEVSTDGVYFNAPNGSGVRFIIPGAGIVKVKAKVSNESNGYAFIDFGNDHRQFKNLKAGEYKYYEEAYTGTSETPVMIRFGGGSTNNCWIESIEYIKIDPLISYTATDDNNPAQWAEYTRWAPWGDNITDERPKTFNTYTNSASNSIRAAADANHTITVSNDGYTFSAMANGDCGYLVFPAEVKGQIRVTTSGGEGKKIYISTNAADAADAANWTTLSSNDETSKFTLYTDKADRFIYISVEPGVTITNIAWERGTFAATSAELVAVDKETVWEHNNYFGGYDMNNGVNTPIDENRLNNGRGNTPAHTLLIHSDNGAKGYFNTSHNISFYNSTADQIVDDNIVGVTRMVEFKVRGKGTVLVQAAGSGPTGRSVNISTNGSSKEALAGSSLMTEAHDKYAADGTTLTANEQEHTLDMVRHQYSSYHGIYAYYDGPDDMEQSIYVWAPGGGINIQLIKWFPGQTIYEAANGELSPEGCLTITDAQGNDNIPETIFLRPSKAGATDHNAMFDGTMSYDFYATVNTGDRDVAHTNRVPVWTHSKDGRSGSFEYQNMFTGTHNDYTNLTPEVGRISTSSAHHIAVDQNRVVYASEGNYTKENQVNLRTNAVGDGQVNPGWGIFYVVAGTWEGDRADMRRVEIAGPATGLEIENDVKVINLKPGESFTINAIPFNISTDNDYGVDSAHPHGIPRRMSTIDRPEDVNWALAEGGSDFINLGAQTVNGNMESMTITAQDNITDDKTTTLTVSIVGVKNVDNHWVMETYEVPIVINVKPGMIFLERVVLDGEIVGKDGKVTNVGVTSPLVYQITGDFDPETTKLSAKITQAYGGTTKPEGRIEKIGDNYYVIFDPVPSLKDLGFEHMNYEKEHTVTIHYTPEGLNDTRQVVVQGTDADGNPTTTNIKNGDTPNTVLTFTTEKDDPGTELETFVYNVSQRGKTNADADLTDGGLLSENKTKAPYSDTESWYCNHRSYIKVENFETGVNKSDASDIYLNSTKTGEGENAKTGTITISPYNTNFGKTDKEEAIAGIDITIDENSAANGTVTFYVKDADGKWVPYGEPVTVTNGTVSFADCTFPNTDGKWVHDVKIVVSEGVKIDQIKIDYYSAHRTPLIAKKTFESYNAEKFQGNISNGLQMQGADGNDPEIKIAFRQSSDTRHFALREQWSRYAAEQGTDDELKFRGEKQTRNRKQTVMIMRDDKTDPCEMYIYTNNMVANIMSVELIYETDNDDDQNGFDARSVFCTSDPRYNTEMDVNDNIAGWPLKDMELADGDYTEDTDASTLRKLVYTPESPVSFASFVMNCNEPGYVFVRKILVRYDAKCNAAPYKLNDPNMNGRYNKSRITSVAINTNGIQIGVPKVGNEAEAYLIKRTSTQNNIAKEIVLNGRLDEKALDLDYNGVTLNDNVTGAATDFKHKKFYTVYALDKERMMIRQLAFRTEDNEKPVITRDEVKNSEFRSEEPLTTVPNQITITTSNADGHAPGNTVIIYTTDGSAPSVTFGGNNGRKITAINGEVGCGTGVIFTKDNSKDALNLTKLFAADNKGITNSIVIKALALPLTEGHGINDFNETNLLNKTCTFGEVSAITRANYTLLDQTADEKFFTTARRDANNDVRTNLGDNNPYDITSESLASLAGVLAADANTDDKFHGAYRPMATGTSGPAMMTYGGFELYKSNIEADHKFDHSLVKNDFWQVKANDLNPWRGVSGVVAGDAYVVSNIEPFNENATYKNFVIDASEFTGKGDIRYFKGQFEKSEMDKAPAYAKTWQLPTYGDYFQYEPKDNGTLTVYVKQQGVLDQEGYMLDDELLRFRPVFIYDEAGNTPAGIKASTASKVGGDWMTMKHTNNSASKYLTGTATSALVTMCQEWINKNTCNNKGEVEYGDRAYKPQGVMQLYGALSEDDEDLYTGVYRPAFIGSRGSGNANGFMLISDGYVKYEFPVQAGKSYFMFAANGNLGMCSYTFKKESAQSAASAPRRAGESTGTGKLSITLPGTVESGMVNKTADVTLNRAFAANTWAAIVLPFSVGKHELRNVFGDGVQVIHFTEMQSTELDLTKHIHQMLVAGVPAFIRPTKAVPSGTVFSNVTIETAAVQEITAEVGGYKYKCTGSYNGGTIPKDGWYISGGQFSFRTNSAAAIGGTRSWIEPLQGSEIVNYQLASISFRRFVEDDTDDSEATGISIIGADASTGVASRFLNNNVYSVDGRLVRQNTTSLRGLPAGVYIVNGEKHIVK